MRRSYTVITALAVLLAGVVYYAMSGSFRFSEPLPTASFEVPIITPTPPIAKPRVTYYRAGFAPKDFPKGFLPQLAYASLSSRSITYTSGTRQIMLSYRTSWQIEKIQLFYRTLLSEPEWKIAGQRAITRYGSMYATKNSESFLVTFTGKTGSEEIRVTAVYSIGRK